MLLQIIDKITALIDLPSVLNLGHLDSGFQMILAWKRMLSINNTLTEVDRFASILEAMAKSVPALKVLFAFALSVIAAIYNAYLSYTKREEIEVIDHDRGKINGVTG